MATRKKKQDVNPQIMDAVTLVKGSHLTVITYPDGRTELEWDDEALTRDVREAILNYELANKKPAVKAKSLTRRKKESNV